MQSSKRKISIIGAGAWGTAMAKHLADKGLNVTLWTREKEVKEEIEKKKTNSLYLPKVKLPKNVYATSFLVEALAGENIVIFAVPSQFVRSILAECVGFVASDALVINTAKGIERESNKLMHQVFEDVFSKRISERYVTLSGPSFAREVAEHRPTSVTVASKNKEAARVCSELFSNGNFGAKACKDVIGVELGGSFKNVVAIAVGIAEGLGLGYNSQSIIINKGFSEMIALGNAIGGNRETLLGPAGLGDLVLTCTGHLSRNRKLGMKIAKGERLKDVLRNVCLTAEGVQTCCAVKSLSSEHKLDMPVVRCVFSVLYRGASPGKAIFSLITK